MSQERYVIVINILWSAKIRNITKEEACEIVAQICYDAAEKQNSRREITQKCKTKQNKKAKVQYRRFSESQLPANISQNIVLAGERLCVDGAARCVLSHLQPVHVRHGPVAQSTPNIVFTKSWMIVSPPLINHKLKAPISSQQLCCRPHIVWIECQPPTNNTR